ncbi:FoF1 ATP synthase subunit gamma [Microbulbifer sp. SAOS-129_SWC]|uniref:FoF1 ATP synthase subunit gamma n=1 Tax=Microbulbifer sp. SAOS-129_SWC TaxID=3145235 RepID=UPI00321762B0
MSRRRALEYHREKLGEAREIVSSMKSLAFMETHRVGRFLDSQRRVVRTVEEAAADFLSFYPETLYAEGVAAPSRRVFLLLGSERGFCGNFNETLIDELTQQLRAEPAGEVGIIACGSKLCARLADHPQLLAAVEGAAVSDEVEDTLQRLLQPLDTLQQREGTMSLRALNHEPERDTVLSRDLLPPFTQLPAPAGDFHYPPQLNLSPADFLLALVEQYLFAALHEMLYVSLMAENQRRMQHLEGAVRFLDDKLEALRRRGNQLRQEEITEEIEVILLSADNAGAGSPLPVRGRE